MRVSLRLFVIAVVTPLLCGGCSLLVDWANFSDGNSATQDGGGSADTGGGSDAGGTDALAAADGATAISIVELTHASSGTDGVSFATTAITVNADDVLVVDVLSVLVDPGNAQSPSTIAGAGMTFTKVLEVNGGSGTINNLSRWRAKATGAMTAALTLSYVDTMDGVIWSVNRIDGCRKTGTNGADAFVQSTSMFATSGSSSAVTLNSFTNPKHATLGVFSAESQTGNALSASPKAAFARLTQDTVAPAGVDDSMAVVWLAAADTTPSVSWNGNSSSLRALATEIAY